MSEIKIAENINKLEQIFGRLINDVPFFKVLDEEILPYGLNQHTRSICWLAEQVILQNIKKRQSEYGIDVFTDPDSDISAWDASLKLAGDSTPCFINIKVSDVTKPTRRNDIASVKKLLSFYDESPSANLFYVVIMLRFDRNTIRFQPPAIVRYYPWIEGFVVNSRNHHIQSIYPCSVKKRSIEEFLDIVREKAKVRNVL